MDFPIPPLTPRHSSYCEEGGETPRARVTLVPQQREPSPGNSTVERTAVTARPGKPPTAEKPSLSTTFLEQKRRDLEALTQRCAASPTPEPQASSSQDEMTNSCLEV